MLEKVHACEHSDFGEFVKEHAASVMKQVQAHDVSQKKSDFMKHYKLVNKINGVEIEE